MKNIKKEIQILTKVIQETITRGCCDFYKDLECVNKEFNIVAYRHRDDIYRCRYCGQYWCWERYCDAAGSMDSQLVRCNKPRKHKL